MLALSYKSAPSEFKADATEDGLYEGYFAVFGNVDDGGDVIEAGAFAKSLAERGPSSPRNRIKVAYFHRSGLTKELPVIVGAPPEVLSEDSHGLYAKGRLVLGTQAGRETWELMKAGALTEGSIGYETIPARTRFEKGLRYLSELKLWELSFVPFGMNPATNLQAVKSVASFAAIKALYDSDYFDACDARELLTLLLSYLVQGRLLAGADPDDLLTAWGLLGDAQGVLAGLITAAGDATAGKTLPARALDTLTLLTTEWKAGRLPAPAPERLPALRDLYQDALAHCQTLLDAATPDEAKAAVHLAPQAARARLLMLELALAAAPAR
jgi:HK97 family phage prohead protease